MDEQKDPGLRSPLRGAVRGIAKDAQEQGLSLAEYLERAHKSLSQMPGAFVAPLSLVGLTDAEMDAVLREPRVGLKDLFGAAEEYYLKYEQYFVDHHAGKHFSMDSAEVPRGFYSITEHSWFSPTEHDNRDPALKLKRGDATRHYYCRQIPAALPPR